MFQTNRNPIVLTWQKTRSDCNIMVFKYTIYYSVYQPLAKHFILYSVNHENKQTEPHWAKHGTIIQTGITCKKILCYMCDSASRWPIVKNAKIFQSYVKHF